MKWDTPQPELFTEQQNSRLVDDESSQEKKYGSNDKCISEGTENIVGNEENTGFQYFHLFLQWFFQRISFAWERV